jgi:hypothetical protein
MTKAINLQSKKTLQPFTVLGFGRKPKAWQLNAVLAAALYRIYHKRYNANLKLTPSILSRIFLKVKKEFVNDITFGAR